MRQHEHIEQVKLFTWAKAQSKKYPQLDNMFAIPNGGQRNIIVASKLKAEGVKSGVPDIFLAFPSSNHNGLFIEMKSAKGRLSPNQKSWIEALTDNGYLCEVCYSFDEAREKIKAYLEI